MSDHHLVLRPDVVATVFEDGAVLLDLESKYFYSVNAGGWGIVQMLENGVSREQIEAQCRDWGASVADQEAIREFVNVFEADGLVTSEVDGAVSDEVVLDGAWVAPTIEKQREPLQRIITSAFDPSLPLAE